MFYLHATLSDYIFLLSQWIIVGLMTIYAARRLRNDPDNRLLKNFLYIFLCICLFLLVRFPSPFRYFLDINLGLEGNVTIIEYIVLMGVVMLAHVLVRNISVNSFDAFSLKYYKLSGSLYILASIIVAISYLRIDFDENIMYSLMVLAVRLRDPYAIVFVFVSFAYIGTVSLLIARDLLKIAQNTADRPRRAALILITWGVSCAVLISLFQILVLISIFTPIQFIDWYWYRRVGRLGFIVAVITIGIGSLSFTKRLRTVILFLFTFYHFLHLLPLTKKLGLLDNYKRVFKTIPNPKSFEFEVYRLCIAIQDIVLSNLETADWNTVEKIFLDHKLGEKEKKLLIEGIITDPRNRSDTASIDNKKIKFRDYKPRGFLEELEFLSSTSRLLGGFKYRFAVSVKGRFLPRYLQAQSFIYFIYSVIFLFITIAFATPSIMIFNERIQSTSLLVNEGLVVDNGDEGFHQAGKWNLSNNQWLGSCTGIDGDAQWFGYKSGSSKIETASWCGNLDQGQYLVQVFIPRMDTAMPDSEMVLYYINTTNQIYSIPQNTKYCQWITIDKVNIVSQHQTCVSIVGAEDPNGENRSIIVDAIRFLEVDQ
ncbi:MAG: hypothetical protein KF758_10985 [Anaerolineales bacterium]|nr:hypothetical protein [Anaerolineales bacterium]